ncbi:MAG TPA: KamA family radical SAM protein [Anaerolineaceae bacterium]|nr:KamA family radical SAM protein [Anaerolineaceae bacterium]HPN53796.1 KamA family radical SAM protein [Anaerolineaceae bacterium]
MRESRPLPENWDEWQWQMQNAISSIEQLEEWVDLNPDEKKAILATASRYRWRVTPYYASLMDPHDPACPIRRQVIPSLQELRQYPHASADPVGDTTYLKTRRVIHKYPDRAIILATEACASYCRHCTRKYHTTALEGSYYNAANSSDWADDFEYIAQTPQIRDVLLTGGDPLVYSDDFLEFILSQLRLIPHVEIIRIGSRFPVFLPQRITPKLCAILEKYGPVWFSTHFNHPKEITPQAAQAVDLLLHHGIPVQNQSVLLKGVNDNLDIMRSLLTRLVQIKVRPYYIYHCDNALGVSHFATSLETGRAIMRGLTGFITGFAVPLYVLTTPIGKISLCEEKFTLNEGHYWVENYHGDRMCVDDLLLSGE